MSKFPTIEALRPELEALASGNGHASDEPFHLDVSTAKALCEIPDPPDTG